MCFCVMVVVGCIEQTQAATDVLFGCSWNVRATIALHLDVYPTLCMAVCQKKGWKKQIRCGLMVGWWLDYVILKVFSSLYGSMLELFFFWLTLRLRLCVGYGGLGLLEYQSYFVVSNEDALHLLAPSVGFVFHWSPCKGFLALWPAKHFRKGWI